MKEQILKIAKDLEQGTITPEQAQTLLLGLFSVSKPCCTECDSTNVIIKSYCYDCGSSGW